MVHRVTNNEVSSDFFEPRHINKGEQMIDMILIRFRT